MPFKQIIQIICLLLLFTACNNQKSDNQQSAVPTEEEKAQAIKDILKQGVDQATRVLSKENGFLTNDSLKISLPAEAQSLIDNVKKLPQGKELLDNAITQINQVAGSSVEKIAPVMYAAIDSMSVEDVNRILLADSAAATAYLEKVTREPIQKACEPIIIESLDKKVWGEVTVEESWTLLVDNYNKLAGSTVGRIAKMEPVDMVLEEFVTGKVLDAVFYLIAKEEMSIRKHPATRISKSLAKTLGWIEK